MNVANFVGRRRLFRAAFGDGGGGEEAQDRQDEGGGLVVILWGALGDDAYPAAGALEVSAGEDAVGRVGGAVGAVCPGGEGGAIVGAAAVWHAGGEVGVVEGPREAVGVEQWVLGAVGGAERLVGYAG